MPGAQEASPNVSAPIAMKVFKALVLWAGFQKGGSILLHYFGGHSSAPSFL